MVLMREQALVLDAHPAYRAPSLLWRLACELAPSPHLPLPPGHRDLADAALRWLAANSQEFPSSQDNVGPLYGAGLRQVPSFALLVSSPHRPISPCLLGIGTWQMRLFAGWQPIRRSSLPAKTTLALFMVLVYGRYHLLRQPLPSDCEWQPWLTSGLPPAVPLLSALAFLFHLAPICCTASSLSSFSLSSLLTRDRQR